LTSWQVDKGRNEQGRDCVPSGWPAGKLISPPVSLAPVPTCQRAPRSLRLLYFHQHFSTPAGASGTLSYEFARELVRRGHRV